MSAAKPEILTQEVFQALNSLVGDTYPHVPNPPTCSKRASVALIIRLRPDYSHWPSSTSDSLHNKAIGSTTQRLNNFSSQEWTKNADPEVLFIKRAARSGDRWTSHVALPGGKRDPEDASDKATAIRETMEEVGINLEDDDALYVGNLPERVVTISFGKTPYVKRYPYLKNCRTVC